MDQLKVRRKRPGDLWQPGVKAKEEFFRAITQHCAAGIIVAGEGGTILFLNPAAERLFDRPLEAMIGQSFEYLTLSDDPVEIEIERPEKDTLVVEVHVSEARFENESLYVANLFDVTEHVRLREGMRALSLVDELTGLYNRRGFLTLAQQQLKLANRTRRGMLLVFADLDKLKWVNDTFGHREGDLALIETATILKETFRDSDIIARIAGDEFAVIAMETGKSHTGVLAGRLQKQLDVHNAFPNRRYPISVSLGIAYYDPDQPCSIDELLNEADVLMYQHKWAKYNSKELQSQGQVVRESV